MIQPQQHRQLTRQRRQHWAPRARIWPVHEYKRILDIRLKKWQITNSKNSMIRKSQVLNDNHNINRGYHEMLRREREFNAHNHREPPQREYDQIHHHRDRSDRDYDHRSSSYRDNDNNQYSTQSNHNNRSPRNHRHYHYGGSDERDSSREFMRRNDSRDRNSYGSNDNRNSRTQNTGKLKEN